MATSASEIAVAFVIREKFSIALASLKRLYALAGAPFTLYFVDGRYPPALREALYGFLADKPNVVRIEAGRFLYPSEALNLVLAHATEPYLFVLQNDVLIGKDALARLAASARELGADVVVPEVLDLADGAPARHRDLDHDVPIAFVEREGKIHAPPEPAPRWNGACRRIDYFELHCLFARTLILRSRAPLAPLNVHEHVDLSISLWRAGQRAYRDERVQVLYAGSPPLPLRDIECAYFRFRWELARARQSDKYLREKWPIAELFQPDHFIAHQQQALEPHALLASYDSAFSADAWPEVFGVS